jgi:hypothetical protein
MDGDGRKISRAEKWVFPDFPTSAASAVAVAAMAGEKASDFAAAATTDKTAGKPAPPISACDSLLNSSFIIPPFQTGIPRPFIRRTLQLTYSFVNRYLKEFFGKV